VTRIQKSALIPYHVSDIYGLVSNVEGYPHFLPWCQTVTIASLIELETHAEVIATITMGRIGLEKSFTTTNILKKDESIHIRLLNGPFSHLQGHWHFQALGNEGCKVSLEMEFHIANKLLSMSLGPIFSKIINSLIDAFIIRANKLYGKQRHLG